MIAFVHGMAVDMTESSVVVEAGGIGYEIYMTGADLSEIRMGEDVKVHTYFSRNWYSNCKRCYRKIFRNCIC